MASNSKIFQFQNVKDYIKAKIAEVDLRNEVDIECLVKKLMTILLPIVDEFTWVYSNQVGFGRELVVGEDE